MENKKVYRKPKNTTKPGNPLWDEYTAPDGTYSLEVHDPIKITKHDTCEHFFEFKDNSAICKYCGLGQPIIVGLQFIKEGRIIQLSQDHTIE